MAPTNDRPSHRRNQTNAASSSRAHDRHPASHPVTSTTRGRQAARSRASPGLRLQDRMTFDIAIRGQGREQPQETVQRNQCMTDTAFRMAAQANSNKAASRLHPSSTPITHATASATAVTQATHNTTQPVQASSSISLRPPSLPGLRTDPPIRRVNQSGRITKPSTRPLNRYRGNDPIKRLVTNKKLQAILADKPLPRERVRRDMDLRMGLSKVTK